MPALFTLPNQLNVMRLFSLIFCLLFSPLIFASHESIDLTQHWAGITALVCFVMAYIVVILEEKLHMRKSKPVLLSAGIIWMMIAIAYRLELGDNHMVEKAIRHNFLEYVELFFFLLVAMTYINAMIERGVFDALKNWLVSKGFTFRQLFWLTGIFAFFISPIADNLTTALIMCTVVLSVGKGHKEFISLACINIVVAANAGGAFSPFGDITTLMVWQKGILEFSTFFHLFFPAAISFVVPAAIMHFFVPNQKPDIQADNKHSLKYGGLFMVALFLLTIVTAISFHSFLHIPPVFGMMVGLSYLKFFGFYLRHHKHVPKGNVMAPMANPQAEQFDVFDKVAKSEWDTLFFFYGVIMSVGGLAYMGYLSIASELIYGSLGNTTANILVGIISAIVDNIPVMFAVLTMNPAMNELQWLLVTLTAGIGGSLLSIGSAAGVALMGQARGYYTFFSHLKWTPVIALGYGLGIYSHFLING